MVVGGKVVVGINDEGYSRSTIGISAGHIFQVKFAAIQGSNVAVRVY